MADRTLEVEGVHKEYGAGDAVTRALDGVDLVLERGELTALVGPSGSGKSTLLNLLGLLERPTRGRIRLDGVDTGALRSGALARHRGATLGFVFQAHHLLPEFSALENVMLPMIAARGRADRAMADRAGRLLADVGLGAHAGKRPHQLSGGQQQRVAVARALAMGPKLVLADEPTGNLDTRAADEVFALLRGFNREAGVTCLVVTHDARLAERCDRVVELVDGRIVSDRGSRGP